MNRLCITKTMFDICPKDRNNMMNDIKSWLYKLLKCHEPPPPPHWCHNLAKLM